MLNGKRHSLISSFRLSPQEVEFVMTIRANSLEEFAGQLDGWIAKAQGAIEPPALPVPLHRGKHLPVLHNQPEPIGL